MAAYDVLIIGAGHAGAQAAITLRQSGFGGSVGLIGDEPYPPYERPPLSKEYFAGDKSFERILLRPPSFWAERRIELLLGKRVDRVDAVRKLVAAGEEEIGYDKLIWSAGGTPRKLACEGSHAVNVHTVRRRDDVEAMLAQMNNTRYVTIIGGGYIGLEATAVFVKFGKKVVLLESLDRVLARVAGVPLSRFYEAEHRAHGVDLRTGASIDRFEMEAGRVVAVLMRDGERIETDMVIVGIGITPETGPLIAAGAQGRNGVDVDQFCRTSLPNIYAVGDCAAHINRFAAGERIRLESVQNANDQAKTAVSHIMGNLDPYDAVPWFWSNQYDLKLQTVGLSGGHDRVIVRGNPASRSFSLLYVKEGRLIAVDSVNSVKDYVQARSHIVSGAVLDQAQMADEAVPLKNLAERQA